MRSFCHLRVKRSRQRGERGKRENCGEEFSHGDTRHLTCDRFITASSGATIRSNHDEFRRLEVKLCRFCMPFRRFPPRSRSATIGRARRSRALFALPFPELMFRAAQTHREYFDPTEVQISTLLSIKTGGCPEDCAYCPQSAQYDTGVKAEKLMAVEAVLAEARAAKANGASRFCMGAAWREPKDRDLDVRLRHGRGRQGARPRDLRHARHADGAIRRRGSKPPASTTTTTTSTPRRSSTARSSPRAPTATASTRSAMCATPASMSAAAALSAWARGSTTASA